MSFIKDGEAVRFVADDGTLDPVQRAVAEAQSRSIDGTSSSLAMMLDGSPAIRRYNERLENAWRNGEQP